MNIDEQIDIITARVIDHARSMADFDTISRVYLKTIIRYEGYIQRTKIAITENDKSSKMYDESSALMFRDIFNEEKASKDKEFKESCEIVSEYSTRCNKCFIMDIIDDGMEVDFKFIFYNKNGTEYSDHQFITL